MPSAASRSRAIAGWLLLAGAAVTAILVAMERSQELQSIDSYTAEAVEHPSTPAPVTTSDDLFSKRLRLKSRAATVRVVNRSERITGSGTVVAAGADFACVLTAAHLVRFGDEIAIDVFDGLELRAARSVSDVQVWGLDPRNDLALLWVSGEARLAVSMKIRPLQVTPAAEGVAVLALACTDSDPPAFYFETVTRREVRKRATAEPVEIWEGERLGFRGQSGGALVDSDGYVIGVRSGIAGGKAYYAHHSAIHQFLQTSEFFTRSDASGAPPGHTDLLRSLSEKRSPETTLRRQAA